MQAEENCQVDMWRISGVEADFLSGAFQNFAYDTHTHETACFALMVKGSACVRMKGQKLRVSAGELYAIDADEPHSATSADGEGWQLRTLYVDTATLADIVEPGIKSATRRICGPVITRPELVRSLYTLHHYAEHSSSRLQQDGCLLNFASELIRHHMKDHKDTLPSVGNEKKAVVRARDYIDQRLADNISLEMLSEESGLPRYVLYRAFEKKYGMSPHSYQRQARVQHAQKLIRKNLSLAEACALSGFSDQAHMNRWFRRIMGITPGSFRRAVCL